MLAAGRRYLGFSRRCQSSCGLTTSTSNFSIKLKPRDSAPRAILLDNEGKRLVARLPIDTNSFHCDGGLISTDDIKANSFGGQVVSNKGQTYLVLPFNLEDFVLSGLSRQATPIYPKEAAAILQILDLQEGKRVLETGTGSGAFSLYLSRAVGRTGSVVTFEVRQSAFESALYNVACWRTLCRVENPDIPVEVDPGIYSPTGSLQLGNITFSNSDLAEAGALLECGYFDAAVLDVMTPWDILSAALRAVKGGAPIAVICPNITQALDLIVYAQNSGACVRVIDVKEHQVRRWDVRPPAMARPSHHQVHHVAFVVHLVKVNSAGSVVDFRRKDKRLSQMEIFAASEKTLAPCPSDDDS